MTKRTPRKKNGCSLENRFISSGTSEVRSGFETMDGAETWLGGGMVGISAQNWEGRSSLGKNRRHRWSGWNLLVIMVMVNHGE